MEKMVLAGDEYEIVDFVPYGYVIWNIGRNMPDGYLPLVQVGGYDGCQVLPTPKKAIRVKEAQVILNAIGRGPKTIKDMKKYIEKHKDSVYPGVINDIKKMKEALPIMESLKWSDKSLL